MLQEFALFLVKRKRLLIVNFVIIALVGWAYAWFVPKKEYKAEITFLPPAGESTSPLALMGISLPSLSEPSIMTEQIETIFNSKVLKRRIIEQFDFYEIFKLKNKVNKFERTAGKLKKYILLQTEERGSMGFEKVLSYTVVCFHPSADTVKLMCEFVFSLLDSSVREISMDRAERNRMFIELQLDINKKQLDSLQREFKKFQVANKAYIVEEQVKLSLKTYAEIKSALILNELKIRALEREFQRDLPELEELRKMQKVYNQKLAQIESENDPSVFMSLGFAAKVLPQYVNLLREGEVRNEVILMLEREHEQARLQESKNITSLVVVDPPYVPEYKSRPKRVVLLGMALVIEHLLLMLLLSYQFLYARVLRNHEGFQDLLKAMKSGN